MPPLEQERLLPETWSGMFVLRDGCSSEVMTAAPTVATWVDPSAALHPDPSRIEVGHGSVVGPNVQLLATDGRIVIGQYCLLEEGCCIENLLGSVAPAGSGAADATTLFIDDFTVIGVKSCVRSRRVGKRCRILPKAVLGVGSTVEDGSAVAATGYVGIEQTIPAGHIVIRAPQCTHSFSALPSAASGTAAMRGAEDALLREAFVCRPRPTNAQEEEQEVVGMTRWFRTASRVETLGGAPAASKAKAAAALAALAATK